MFEIADKNRGRMKQFSACQGWKSELSISFGDQAGLIKYSTPEEFAHISAKIRNSY
jgi:hypothetical protein